MLIAIQNKEMLSTSDIHTHCLAISMPPVASHMASSPYKRGKNDSSSLQIVRQTGMFRRGENMSRQDSVISRKIPYLSGRNFGVKRKNE